MRAPFLPLTVAAVALTPWTVLAAASPRFQVGAGSLATALTALARQANVDILFSERLVGDQTSPGLEGTMTVEAGLAKLLAGSGFSYKRTSDGVFIITSAREAVTGEPTRLETIPEILIVGHLSQNTDIRRTADDLQPYQVATLQGIEDAHSSTVGDFIRTRLPGNAITGSPAQDLLRGAGSTRSSIDLRGLGSSQTLVLVDGRRMPSIPGLPRDFEQPDINGIPVDVVERIETLTATAGGIYGPGATGGVVNLILRRDYRGAEANLTTGLTSRGDSPLFRAGVRLGFTPDDGRTDVMITFSTTRSDVPRASRRDYHDRARKWRYANDPVAFLAAGPIGNAINIIGDEDLVLKPEYGGTALGSAITSLPVGLDGDQTRRSMLLAANAGRINLDRPSIPDSPPDRLASRPTTQAILFDARHRIGDSGITAFIDVIDNRNNGLLENYSDAFGLGSRLDATDPFNPFLQPVTVTFPNGISFVRQTNKTHVLRYTTGLIATLPGTWRVNIEYTGGFARTKVRQDVSNNAFYYFSGGPPLDPLGNWITFLTGIETYRATQSTNLSQTSRINDGAARFGGPLLDLPGGAATLTLLLEARRERVSTSTQILSTTGFETLRYNLSPISRSTRSIGGELRLPVSGEHGLLRDLEVGAAIRRDRVVSRIIAGTIIDGADTNAADNRNTAITYTLGAKFAPLSGLLLRASAASGVLPPSLDQISSTSLLVGSTLPDPERGGRPVGSEAQFVLVSGGSTALNSERARSVSAGVVAKPFGADGLRMSADWVQISKRREIAPLPGVTLASLIAGTTNYQQRLQRAPLTPEDAVLGFTGGVVTRVDLTTTNVARSRLDALDLSVDYPLATSRFGRFRFYLNATWEPRFWRQGAKGQPRQNRIGYSDGPLEWRGNGGIDWSSGAVRVGVNGQFYSRYRVAQSSNQEQNAQLLAYQGRTHVPAQFYFDLSGAYRSKNRGTGFLPAATEFRLGILNLLDYRPPTVTDPLSAGYSYLGDPRRRRVELSVSVPFGV